MDLPSLSSKLVLFFFIVLRLQYPQLDPVVEYTKDAADGRFYAKLTMYRDSLKIPALGFNFCLVKYGSIRSLYGLLNKAMRRSPVALLRNRCPRVDRSCKGLESASNIIQPSSKLADEMTAVFRVQHLD